MIRRALTVVTCLVVLVLAVGVIGPLRHAALANPLLSDLIGTSAVSGDGGSTLAVRSELPPLWPGFHGTFQAHVSSPAEATGAVRIQSIAVRVGDASPACTAENLSIPAYTWTPTSAQYTVHPGQVVPVPMSITMPDTGRNQDGCQGASFPITYTVTAATI